MPKLTVRKLKSLIREAIGGSPQRVPKTFSDFRKLISNAFSYASVPEDLIEEILDTDVDGSSVQEALLKMWQSIESELRGSQSWDADTGEFIAEVSRDLVFDVVDAYTNAMNYERGRKINHIDADELARKVRQYIIRLSGTR